MLKAQLWSSGWSNGRMSTWGYTSPLYVDPVQGRVYYYPKTLRNIIIALLDLFDYMTVKDYSADGSLCKIIQVPITFGPVRKYQQLNLQSESGKKYYLQVPRLALEYTGTTYDSSRTVAANETRFFYDTNLQIANIDSFMSDIQPAPYNYTFNLHLRTRALNHYCQLTENILPWFDPALYLRVKEFSFLNIERDLKVSLDSFTPEFTDEQDNNNVREVNGVATFTVYGFMYRPIISAGLIKKIRYSSYYTDENNEYAIKASKYFTDKDGEFRESYPL